MKNKIEKMDVIALLQDLPEEKLYRGDIGTVVETLDNDVFLVEICDKNGKTLNMVELHNEFIMKLNYEFEYA